jgi:ATP-dependent DNA ligase
MWHGNVQRYSNSNGLNKKYIEGHGSAYFDLVQAQGLEGIVLKRKDSRYEMGTRSKS